METVRPTNSTNKNPTPPKNSQSSWRPGYGTISFLSILAVLLWFFWPAQIGSIEGVKQLATLKAGQSAELFEGDLFVSLKSPMIPMWGIGDLDALDLTIVVGSPGVSSKTYEQLGVGDSESFLGYDVRVTKINFRSVEILVQQLR